MSRLILALSLAALLAAPAPAAEEPAPGRPQTSREGQQTYQQLCQNCHGPLGKGDGPAGLAAQPMPRDFSVGQFKFDADSDGQTGTDQDLFLVIRNGALAAGGSPLMAAWSQIGDAKIHALVAYVRSLEGSR